MNEDTEVQAAASGDSQGSLAAAAGAAVAGDASQPELAQQEQPASNVETTAAIDDHATASVVDTVTPVLDDSAAAHPELSGNVQNDQPHPGHAIIDEILRALHVQNAGEWMRAKLEELRKTL